VKAGDDQLASELCRFGDQRFICATLSLPIRGSDDHVVIALWAEVPHEGFYAYIKSLDGGATPAPLAANLSSDLGSICTQGTEIKLSFEIGEARPAATLAAITDISLDHLIDLYEATGTLDRSDLKPQ
jgi:hypothetical protein